MKPTHPVSIGELLHGIQREEGFETRLLERRAVRLWPTVAAAVGGPGLPAHAPAVDVAHGALMLRVTSAPLRQEITMRSNQLIDSLNARLGTEKPVITHIRYVGG